MAILDAREELVVVGEAPPPTVSVRRHLRDGLPEIYRQHDFSMRFVQGFEQVLDPVVATLDSLVPLFDAKLAPSHALAGMAAWLGVDEVESLPVEQRRRALLRAGELARLRGTRAGLQLALELFFPDTPLRIDDHGSVLVEEEAVDEIPRAPAVSFDVYCDEPLPTAMQQAIARCIERWKPAHAKHRLRVKKARSKSRGGGGA